MRSPIFDADALLALIEDAVARGVAQALAERAAADAKRPSAAAEPLLTTKAAANYLSLARNTLEQLRVKGNGPEYEQFGRAVRYRRAALDAWGAKRANTSEAQMPKAATRRR